jgi:tagatose 1,6-diphosphate aldolase
MNNNFKFLTPPKMIDDELELVLVNTYQANTEEKLVPWYEFKMQNTITKENMGYLNLRIGSEKILHYAGHIGYGVDSKFQGHHYAARSVKLILPFTALNGIKEALMSCSTDNIASQKTCTSAGFEYIETTQVPPDQRMYREGYRNIKRYRIYL